MKRHVRSLFPLILLIGAIDCLEGGQRRPFERTEKREDCAHFDPLRKPLFGDLHIHTSFSFDAALRVTLNDPRDALRFARGEALSLPDAQGRPTRSITIDRALDFAAVTDHSEFFGEVKICTTPDLPGFNSARCLAFRSRNLPSGLVNTTWTTTTIGAPNTVFSDPERFPFCFQDGRGGRTAQPLNCLNNAVTFWEEIQAAAEEAYDRSSSCTFTSFVAYEWTGTPNGTNLHRNVIFRNRSVPELPTSYMETGPDPAGLWSRLQDECLRADDGCDVITITHNANLGGPTPDSGIDFQLFPDPASAQEGAMRQRFEPLTEIIQHKGASECRPGVGNEKDEVCGFEMLSQLNFATPASEPNEFPQRNFIRNVLKDGLALERRLGVNPFKVGLVGSTDTHNGTPGTASEEDWPGHDGADDADAVGRLQAVERGPGGLAVVWAEENSRDAIFSALRRRETYATSGTRPIVRFFGGWTLPPNLCGDPDFVKVADQRGVPMGSDLPRRIPGKLPRFAVLALKDPGTRDAPGTDLQRIQIVKGFLDAEGKARERVFEVAGGPNQATVDPKTCQPVGDGAASLCAVFEDPDFDPSQPAFYYARVLENPTCRWSARECQAEGLDPFNPDACAAALADRDDLSQQQMQTLFVCCSMSQDLHPDPAGERIIPIRIQERAWTSPIWFVPEDDDDDDEDDDDDDDDDDG